MIVEDGMGQLVLQDGRGEAGDGRRCTSSWRIFCQFWPFQNAEMTQMRSRQ